MAAKCGLSSATVARIWQGFALKPHRHETFKLSKDPQFVANARDIAGLYLHPPERAVVLRVDEKVQIQELDRTQSGPSERRTHDYRRHGPTGLFAALDIFTGRVIGECYPRHRAVEFREFLEVIDAAVPPDLEIHLVLDNYGTHHRTKELDTAIEEFHTVQNENPKPFVWTKSADRILESLNNDCQGISETGH